MLTVCSIDPALGNIGIAITTDYVPIHLEKLSLWESGDKTVSKWNSNKIIEKINKNFGLGSRLHKLIHNYADIVCVEVQMRQKMRFVEGLIIGNLSHPKTIALHPVHYKKSMKLATGNYKTNKERAVAWCGTTLDSWSGKGKKDDIADAYCMCCYYTAKFLKKENIPNPIELYVSKHSTRIYSYYSSNNNNGKRSSPSSSPSSSSPPSPQPVAQIYTWDKTRSTQNWARGSRSRKENWQRCETWGENYRTWVQKSRSLGS